MIASILPQVDELNVYLNDYDHVPEALHQPKVNVVLGREAAGDIGDVGKFYFVSQYKPHDVALTCDDDLRYPADYADTMRRRIHSYGSVVAAHGDVLEMPIGTYRTSRRTLSGTGRIDHACRVHVVGTGTTAFQTYNIAPELADFPIKNMADIWFAKLLQEKQVRATVIPHPRGWLQTLLPSDADTLWSRGELPETSEVVRSIDWRLF